MDKSRKLYRTTVILWSETPIDKYLSLDDLARDTGVFHERSDSVEITNPDEFPEEFSFD